MSNDKKKKSLFSSKKFRHGGFSVMMIAAVIVIVALLNVVVSTLDGMWGLSYDLSSNKMYTISAQSKKVLAGVDEDIKIYALMQSGSESHTIEKLLDNYRKEAPDYIDITVIDPVQNPTFANQFTSEALSVNSVIVTNGDGSRYRVIDQYDMYEFGYTSSYQSYVKAFIGEQKLTNAISFVTADQVANAYFLTGHQEVSKTDLAFLVDYIEGENLIVDNIDVTSIDLLKQGDILIIAAPKTDLSEDERVAIKGFLENGGYMVYMTDATGAQLPVFESLLDLYGIKIDHTLVVEGNENYYYRTPVYLVPNIGEHEVTAGLTANEQVSVMPYATSITLPVVARNDIESVALLTTSKSAFGRVDLESTETSKEEGDLDGPLTVAMALSRINSDGEDVGEKIVVFGAHNFVTSSSFYSMSGNTDLLLGAIRWMNGESDTVTIVGKNLMSNSLRFNSTAEMYAMAAVVVIVVPVLVLIVGLAVWLRRRHL